MEADKAMLTSASMFIERLKAKVAMYKNRSMMIVEEPYTSKTCGQCGRMNKELGGSRVYNCVNENCMKNQDRDINAARNILIRILSILMSNQ